MAYRDHESKRARYEHGESDVVDRLTSLIQRVGEQSASTLKDNLLDLTQVLEHDSNTFRDEIVEAIVDCVTAIPEKIGVYSTLVGLLNAKNYDVGEEITKRLAQSLQTALDDDNHTTAIVLVRFLADLVNANVLLATSLTALFDTFLAVLAEEGALQARTDYYVRLVLGALPWVGRALSERNEENLDRILTSVETYIESRAESTFTVLRVFATDDPLPQVEELSTLWAQLTKLQQRKWDETVIRRPYRDCDDILEQALQHTLSAIEVRAHEAGTVYPTARIVFRMFDALDTPEEPIMPPSDAIERQIVETTIMEMTAAYASSHHQCAKQIGEFASQFQGLPMDHVIVEAWFAQLFRLPSAPQLHFYYCVLMTELIRTRETITPVLALAMDILFAKLGEMDVECVTRFSEFCAFFVTFYEFKFRWNDWFEAADVEPTRPVAVFVRETLARTMRLSFHDRVARSVPRELASLLPAEPCYSYLYGRADEDTKQALRLEHLLLDLQRKTCSSRDVLATLDAIEWDKVSAVGDDDLETDEGKLRIKIRVFVSTTLYVGSKSLSHIIHLVEKFHGVFTELATTSEAKLRVVQCVAQFWANNPQMTVILLGRLLIYKIVDTAALVHWVFDDNTLALFSAHHLWEVLFDALDHAVDRPKQLDAKIAALQEQIQSVPEGETMPAAMQRELDEQYAALEEAQGAQRAAFMVAFQHFVKVLSEHLARADQDDGMDYDDHWYKVAVQRWVETARKYSAVLRTSGVFQTLRTLVFDDLDPRLQGTVDDFAKVI